MGWCTIQAIGMTKALSMCVWDNNQRTYWWLALICTVLIVLLDAWYRSPYALAGDLLYGSSGLLLFWLSQQKRIDGNLAVAVHIGMGLLLVGTESRLPPEMHGANTDMALNWEIYDVLSTLATFGMAMFGGLWGLLVGNLGHIVLTYHDSTNPMIQWFLGIAVSSFGLALHKTLHQLYQSQIQLEHIAFHDPLTQLPNRRALEGQYAHYLAIAGRQNLSLLVIVWDIDKLKQINDQQGHQVGDQHLQSFAQALKQHLRAADMAFRTGGDEFCSLHLDLSSGQGIIQRVRESFAGVSVGWVECSNLNLEEALHHADLAMYQDKQIRQANRV